MSAGDGLPPLRDVIARHGLRAEKSLGQNFLTDLNLTGRIARSAGDLAGVTVIEIGPGPGGLTRALLAAGAQRVVAIERDARCLPALAEIGQHWPGRLTVIEADALNVDVAKLADGPMRIVANLPYNVATVLLTGWLTVESWPPAWDSLTLMFQKEVAERIAAAPDTDAYGRLSVLCGWRTQATMLFDISPKAFVPAPKVTSTVVRLVPRSVPMPCHVGRLEQVTRAAFGQRRKMLRQSLKALGGDTAALIAAAGLDPTQRAETVDVAGFVRLADALRAPA
jgi:16S rRNA (adenine1518-N6/adenine1519-N6)-dimethyltransferase